MLLNSKRAKLIVESYHTVFSCLGRQLCCYFASRAFDPSGRVHCSFVGGGRGCEYSRWGVEDRDRWNR